MWWELSVDLARGRFERVSTLLFELGASGVQEEPRPGEGPPPRQPWDTGPKARPTARLIAKAWFEDPDRERLAAKVAREAGLDAGPMKWAPVEEIDWEAQWRANFPVLEVSPRITIAPPWDPRPGALIVEPGQGFGTGQHETTRMALVAVDELAEPGATCLDVGCGSGILAIAAARLGMRAVGIDVEEAAIADAIANAARNGVTGEFSTASVEDVAPAELVVANLHAELIVKLGVELRRVTAHRIVLAGILADREPMVRAVFAGWTLLHRVQDGEWVGLRYERPVSGA